MIEVFLSKNEANIEWGKKSILSFQSKKIIIHVNHNNVFEIVQKAARKISNLNLKKIILTGENWSEKSILFFYLGYSNPKKNGTFKIENLDLKNKFYKKYKIIKWVRTTTNLPSNYLTPKKLVSKTIKFLNKNIDDIKKIKYKIIKGKELFKKNYTGIYHVGKGSKNIPILLEVDYNPTLNKKEPVYICLVGKGITFDSGGYNLKINNSIDFMKFDMAGATLLTGALCLAITQKLKKRVKLYLCCAENLVSRNALKTGDYIQYRNKKIVEVQNTDAEGRLVLADGLIDASKEKPSILIDAATLTGASKLAVGNDYHAIFSFDENLIKNFLQSAKEENELFWRLPLSNSHRNLLKSSFTEISNISSSKFGGSASTAAAFLSFFVKNYKKNWIHIDCSGSYQEFESEKWSVGATAMGLFTISNFLLK